jgi:hypothetical protein
MCVIKNPEKLLRASPVRGIYPYGSRMGEERD